MISFSQRYLWLFISLIGWGGLLISCQTAAPAEEPTTSANTPTAALSLDDLAATPLPTPITSPTFPPPPEPNPIDNQPPPTSPIIILSPTIPPSPSPTSPSAPDLRYLRVRVDETLDQFLQRDDRIVSLVITDLQTGQSISWNPDVAIAGMSLVKLPILLDAYRVMDGLPNIYYTGLISQVTSISSNYAANLLLSLSSGIDDPYVGTDVVTQSMRDLGLYNTFITAPYDSEPRPGRITTYITPANTRLDLNTRPDPNFQTTMGDMATVLELIYQCSQGTGQLLTDDIIGITQADCQQLLDMLTINQLDGFIKGGLPAGTKLAHKHGWIDDTHGNVGVVFTPGGDYLIAIALYQEIYLEWGVSSPTIETISALTYAHFNDPAPYPADMVLPPEPTPSPTPEITLPRAIVNGTQGFGLRLRDRPGGTEVGVLPEGSVVLLLDEEQQQLNGFTWQKIRDPQGLEGWASIDFLVTQ
ncbi:MAG TPA: serine hydrolase [Anaerolineae bacterium]|nr:serine hydrolase [Anaerolineae bacterium]